METIDSGFGSRKPLVAGESFDVDFPLYKGIPGQRLPPSDVVQEEIQGRGGRGGEEDVRSRRGAAEAGPYDDARKDTTLAQAQPTRRQLPKPAVMYAGDQRRYDKSPPAPNRGRPRSISRGNIRDAGPRDHSDSSRGRDQSTGSQASSIHGGQSRDSTPTSRDQFQQQRTHGSAGSRERKPREYGSGGPRDYWERDYPDIRSQTDTPRDYAPRDHQYPKSRDYLDRHGGETYRPARGPAASSRSAAARVEARSQQQVDEPGPMIDTRGHRMRDPYHGGFMSTRSRGTHSDVGSILILIRWTFAVFAREVAQIEPSNEKLLSRHPRTAKTTTNH